MADNLCGPHEGLGRAHAPCPGQVSWVLRELLSASKKIFAGADWKRLPAQAKVGCGITEINPWILQI
jgi:hypothetical protein